MKRRVFISEFVTGGAWPDSQIDGPLACEGQAMLMAAIRDLLTDDAVHVMTTWDKRLGKFPQQLIAADSSRLSIFEVDSTVNERLAFERNCRSASDVLVVAPEFQGILLERRRLFDSLKLPDVSWLGCDADAIEVCSDKLLLSRLMQQHQIQAVPAEPFTFSPDATPKPIDGWRFPIVIKPQDGAGSIETRRVDSQSELERLVQTDWGNEFNYIQQPFIPGQLVSVAAIYQNGTVIQTFPVSMQRVSEDGCFRYLGMDVTPTFSQNWRQPVRELLEEIGGALPGLNGYVGFDLIIPETSPSSLITLEINPRLTTGLIGWQLLSHQQNRAAGLESSASFLLGSATNLVCTQTCKFRLDVDASIAPTT